MFSYEKCITYIYTRIHVCSECLNLDSSSTLSNRLASVIMDR